jgi:hypothetical protein
VQECDRRPHDTAEWDNSALKPRYRAKSDPHNQATPVVRYALVSSFFKVTCWWSISFSALPVHISWSVHKPLLITHLSIQWREKNRSEQCFLDCFSGKACLIVAPQKSTPASVA